MDGTGSRSSSSVTTERHAHQAARPGTGTLTAVLLLALAGYVLARILEILPSGLPRTGIVALDVLSAMTFALIDGARHYRWRGILVFAAICALIGNAAENLGVATGFPFGRYEFIELMGPKLFHVPVLLGLAYIGMAYVSWRVARIILGGLIPSIGRFRIFALPALASLVMVAWDLAQDPVWATVLHGWTWRDGGPWFGVPVSNYLGWFLTVFLIYLAFSAYLDRRLPAANEALPPSLWPPLVLYTLCAAGNVMQVFAPYGTQSAQDPTGKLWRVADITAASALVSIFIMGGFAVLAALRLWGREAVATD